MTALGEFLERFYGPENFFRTVHARVQHTKWSAPQSSSSDRRPPIGRRRQDANPAQESTEHLVFWAQLPDKVRVECTRHKEGRTETTLEIVNGDSNWQRHANGTIETGRRPKKASDGDIHSLPTEFQRHFDRGLLRQCFAALTLEFSGHTRVAGRECLVIRARQVPGTQLWPHWLSFEANAFEFAADVEHAVLLSIKAMVDQEPVETHEVLEVTFDGELDDSLFVYVPEVNEKVQTATPIAERITLEDAVARAPFAVLQPSYTSNSERTPFEVMYHPARPAHKAEWLTISYAGPHKLWINQQSESDESQQSELEWDELLVEGERMQISDPYDEKGLRVLHCRRANTSVTIISNLPTDEMVKIASSLTPIRKPDDQRSNSEDK